MKLDLKLAAAPMVLAAIAGCTSSVQQAGGTQSQASATRVDAAQCADLAGLSGEVLGEQSASIVEAKYNAASAPQPPAPGAPAWAGGTPALPEHCEITGVMRERNGTDGQRYAVRFHMRLPATWNGRFLFQGGGGTNGEIGNAIGASQPGGAPLPPAIPALPALSSRPARAA